MKSIISRRYRIILIAVMMLFIVIKGYQRFSRSYLLEDFTYSYPFQKEWEVPNSPDIDLQELLNTSFHYIGRGAHSYAFLSEDKSYILKIFHYRHLRGKEREGQLNELFYAYRMAYERLPKRSGLLYLRLNPDESKLQLVTVRDRLGRRISLQLHQARFVLQRYGRSAQESIKALLVDGKIEQAKRSLEAIVRVLKEEYLLGLEDYDRGIMHNVGFSNDGSLIHYDVGKLKWTKALNCDDACNPSLQRIYQWLEQQNQTEGALLVTHLKNYWREL